MQAPAFWQRRAHPAVWLLWPFSWLYRMVNFVRGRVVSPYRCGVPVICVGNLTVGGAGKTPTVMALVKELQQRGYNPHIISRGYGGTLRVTTQVNVDAHKAAEVGDEPLLLAHYATCWIGADRVASAKAAVAAGADMIVMDDGLQNPSLYKSFSLCVVDGGYGFGNGCTMPAGPLRESVDAGLKRCNAMLVIGEDVQQLAALYGAQLPAYKGAICADESQVALYAQKRLYAFAGIGRPEKFFTTLRMLGADVVGQKAFADHHPYSADEISSLLADAQAEGATLITTRKDSVRIAQALRSQIAVLDICLEIKDLATLMETCLVSCQKATLE